MKPEIFLNFVFLSKYFSMSLVFLEALTKCYVRNQKCGVLFSIVSSPKGSRVLKVRFE